MKNIYISFLAFLVLFGANNAIAQTAPTELLMTWQAETYTPEKYMGKVMPASDSKITVGADLIAGGRRVDLTTYKVFWYIDEQFYQGATGLARITFPAPHFIGENSIKVRAMVQNYGAGIGKTITVPVVSPEIIIQSSAPSLSASAVPFRLQAYPYFFNIKDPSQLSYDWSLGGTSAGNQNPFTATREMADRGTPAILNLSVSNPNIPIERLTKQITIFR